MKPILVTCLCDHIIFRQIVHLQEICCEIPQPPLVTVLVWLEGQIVSLSSPFAAEAMEQQVNIYQQRAAGALACTCLPRKMWPSDKSCAGDASEIIPVPQGASAHHEARAATRSQSFYLRLGCCLVRESVSLVFYSETGRLFLFALFCVWWLEVFFFTRLIRRSSRRARDWFIWCWRPPEHLCRAYYCIWKTTQAKQMICSFGVTRDRSSDDLSKTPQGGDRGPFFLLWL